MEIETNFVDLELVFALRLNLAWQNKVSTTSHSSSTSEDFKLLKKTEFNDEWLALPFSHPSTF